jgi:DNA (cytosine-5)-methyltransferase 1
MRKLKVNDFFCGCGGMGVAFQNAGYEIAGAWDFDKYAVETYRRNVGDHVKRQDIREMTYKDVPKADVWAFGFPCQDLSVAGKQRGMILKCEDCGQELEINPEEYGNETICPNCSGNNFKAASRSGMFFEIMRLLEETERNNPDDMPAVIIAENVRGLRPYLPVLNIEYERHGYTAHIQMFNSKYWGVSQNRERYAVVGTRDKLGLHFSFPVEQHEFVPKLSSQIEKNVSEKYYLPDEKAQTIIAQALEKLEALGTVHACITPDRVNKRQNGPRAKAEEEPMFTLTAQDLHGVIILEDEQTEESVVADLAAETGLLHPDGVGKTLRVGGGGSTTRKHNYQHIIINPGGESNQR